MFARKPQSDDTRLYLLLLDRALSRVCVLLNTADFPFPGSQFIQNCSSTKPGNSSCGNSYSSMSVFCPDLIFYAILQPSHLYSGGNMQSTTNSKITVFIYFTIALELKLLNCPVDLLCL